MITPTRGALTMIAGLLALTDGGRFNATALTHYVLAGTILPALLRQTVAASRDAAGRDRGEAGCHTASKLSRRRRAIGENGK